MYRIDLGSDQLVSALLGLAESEKPCILDSCGIGHLGSHLLIAGVRPVEILELYDTTEDIFGIIERKFAAGLAGFITISYEFGAQIHKLPPKVSSPNQPAEPHVFLALFDCLIVHDYDSGQTYLKGNRSKFESISELLNRSEATDLDQEFSPSTFVSNFTKDEYIAAIEKIKEQIRQGETYQTNLTQQICAKLPHGLTAEHIFWRLRRSHPAPFAAFIKRGDSTVVSVSPERFIRIEADRNNARTITASPIKGTRPRGNSPREDETLRFELISSEKDRAENTMIVDLLRNDLGRICEFGSVAVETLCAVEEHPTLFHLVSTVRGVLLEQICISEIIRAVFPCGSITGAPKLRTMKIINEIEPSQRGLSMGAIGIHLPASGFDFTNALLDLNVAIRTMVIRGADAVFNVGGGVVIDSDPQMEFDESLLKARALLNALGIIY